VSSVAGVAVGPRDSAGTVRSDQRRGCQHAPVGSRYRPDSGVWARDGGDWGHPALQKAHTHPPGACQSEHASGYRRDEQKRYSRGSHRRLSERPVGAGISGTGSDK